MPPQAVCPGCHSRAVRLSRSRTLWEGLLAWAGVYSFRCRKCRRRFRAPVWHIRDLVYAHCPRCYRQALSTWSEQNYNVPFATAIKLRLGATAYRCEVCRCNFASYRPRRERFMWRRRERTQDAGDSKSGRRPTGSI